MSAFSASRRAVVVERAQHACEYCRLSTRGQVATFPIDHITPRASEGPTELSNLALACPHCNAHKWLHETGLDPLTGLSERLYHPRRDRWQEHFRCSQTEVGILDALTSVGRATIARLQMNDAGMAQLRILLLELGLFPDFRNEES